MLRLLHISGDTSPQDAILEALEVLDLHTKPDAYGLAFAALKQVNAEVST